MDFLLILLCLCICLVRVYAIDIIGYVPEYRCRSLDIESTFSIVTDIVLFSEPEVVIANKGRKFDIDDKFPKYVLEKMKNTAKLYGTRILIGLGGAGRSDHFGSILKDSEKRAQLVEILIKDVILAYGLDGIDLNWQFPQGPREYQLLEAFIQDLRPHCKHITLAYRPFMPENQAKLLRSSNILNLVNRLTIMAYDATDPKTGHHSSFETGTKALKEGVVAGLPKEKLLLGIPFYGREVKNPSNVVTYEDLAVYASSTTKHSIFPDADIANYPESKSSKRLLQYHYNCYETVKQKAEYAKKQGFGGVAIWELGQDCRMNDVNEGNTIHQKTCGNQPSLLSSLTGFRTQKPKKTEL